jgi:hypothetical protein
MMEISVPESNFVELTKIRQANSTNTNQTNHNEDVEPRTQNRKNKNLVLLSIRKVKRTIQSCLHRTVIESCWLIKNRFANKVILLLLSVITVWLLGFIIFGKEALPGGLYFSILILIITAHIIAFLLNKLRVPLPLGIVFLFVQFLLMLLK